MMNSPLSFYLSKRAVVAFVACIFISFSFVLVPWEALRLGEFWDREVYRQHFEHGYSKLDFFEYGSALSYVTDEFLWYYIISGLNRLGLDLELIFYLISFFYMAVFSIYVVKKAGYVYVLFLLNPLVVDLAHSQMRLALALSILLFAFESRKAVLFLILALAASAVHTAAILFSALWVIVRFLSGRPFNNVILMLLISLFLAVILGPAREMVLSLVGDRRAEYEIYEHSLVYASIWVLLLFFLSLKRGENWRRPELVFAFTLLGLVCFNFIFKTYNSRFVAAGIPFFAIAISHLSVLPRSLMAFFSAVYFSAHWYLWSSLG